MSLRKAIEDAAADNSVTIEHQGSDLNALDELNADLEAGVVYQGSDLNYLELILANIPVVPSLAFQWNEAIGDNVDLAPPDYLSATINLQGALETNSSDYVMPAGVMTGENVNFDLSSDGEATVAVTYPTGVTPGEDLFGWSLGVYINAPGQDLVCGAEVSLRMDGTFNSTAVASGEDPVAEAVVTGGTIAQMPAEITVRRNGANLEILFDGVLVRAFASAATRGAIYLEAIERNGLTLAGPTAIGATLSYTFPVVAAGE